ncbi:MAG: DNA polymerase III subunit delta [Phycisphaerae bacterium]|nr:DNA polymerase III subunit delta [Phycisphaerae bacterium]
MARSRKNRPSAAIRLSDFLKEKPAAPKPVYVLCGADPYLLDQGRQAVRRAVFGDADPGIGLEELDGPETDAARVLDTLRTPPLLAPRRLLVIREADPFVQRFRAALEKYLDAPAAGASLALEVANWNENTKLAEAVTRAGRLVRCEADQPDRIPAWLQREARRRHGKELSFAAAEMLLEHLGPDLGALVSALEMLDLYTAGAPRVDTADVDALIARGCHERAWALCNAVAEQNLARAMELLDAFWAEGMVAPQIVGLLRVQLKQLVRVRAFGRAMSLDAAMAKAGVPRHAFARLRRNMEALTGAHLADAYQAMVDADLAAKTGAHDRLAMDLLVHRLCNPEAASRHAGTAAPADEP